MRRLADELGVGTMTLYGYFRGKAELLDAVMDAAAPAVDLPVADAPWRERIAALARATRASLERHPALDPDPPRPADDQAEPVPR